MPQTRHIWKTYQSVKNLGRVGNSNWQARKHTEKRFQRQAAPYDTNLLFPPFSNLLATIVRLRGLTGSVLLVESVCGVCSVC
jgi:hypothetical protein